MTSPGRGRSIPGTLLALAIVAATWGTAPAAPIIEQTFELRPGWNAIYLEVRPENVDIATVFEGIPVKSVWTWQPRSSTVEFIRDPSEGLLHRPGWFGYFPPGPEEFLTNLYAVQAHHAYLVNLAPEAGPRTLTIRGTPIVRKTDWTPNSFNLVGFPVDPDNAPTFGDFLAPSEAHRGQPIYRLGFTGEWEPVTAPRTERIRAGEAYWVYTQGASDFTAPIDIDSEFGDGLEFGSLLSERTLKIANLAADDRSVVVRRGGSLSSAPLCHWRLDTRIDPETGAESVRNAWPDLASEHVVELAGGAERSLRLAIRRSQLTADEIEGVLEITDGLGTRRLVPVSATSVEGAVAAVPGAGLWVGNVVIDRVEEVRADSTSPVPTGSEFDFRVILHSDGTTVTLLKQIYQMWDPTDESYVLVTNDDLLSSFEPASMIDGEPVSYRVSSVAYDFDGNELAGSGSMAPGESLTFQIALPADGATNPFRHRYHPDHDDDIQASDIDADPTGGSGTTPYDIVRSWTLSFAMDDPTGQNPPEWGDTIVGGTFSEVLNGLHHEPIDVQGTFRLWRISDDPDLNPQG